MKTPKIIFALVALITITGCGKDPSSSSSSSSGSEEEKRPVRYTADNLTFTPTPLAITNEEWVSLPNMTDSQTYWRNVDWSLRGDALLQALKTEMRKTFKQVTYSGALDAAKEMDRDPAKSTNILSLYDLKSQPAAGYNGGKWNREHTFPQSKLYDETGKINVRANANEKNIASDVANIFACDASLNESRSNNSYGGNWNYDENPDIYYKRLQENTDKELTDNILYYGLYSPSPIVRGEIARAQLYMLVNWAGHVTRDSNFAIETMLEWDMQQAPIAERDGQRQTGILKHQAIRNPFIDNRKVGCYIWSDVNTRTRKVCAGIV